MEVNKYDIQMVGRTYPGYKGHNDQHYNAKEPKFHNHRTFLNQKLILTF